MKVFKFSVVFFVLGAVAGICGGGYLGYKIGSVDNSIDHATTATVVPVQEITKTKPKTTPKPTEVAPAITEEAPAEEAPAETPVEEAPAEAPADEAPVEETPTEEVVATSGSEENFVIGDNDDSFIEWVGYKSLLGKRLSMKGGFMEFGGTITVVDDSPDESAVELTIDLTELYSENVILTRVLKAEFFFAVDEYPTAEFVSSKVEPLDDGKFMVTGNLTMRGTTVGIQFPAVIERRGDKAYAAAEFTIDRKHWNVGYEEYDGYLIHNEVVVSFEILADPA